MLASGSGDRMMRDGTVRLWDTGTGALLQTLEGHWASVNSVTFWDNVIGVSPLLLRGTVSPQAALVNVKKDWVIVNGKETIWLPPEYRPRTVAVYNRVIAIGSASGRTFFLKFEQKRKPKVDATVQSHLLGTSSLPLVGLLVPS